MAYLIFKRVVEYVMCMNGQFFSVFFAPSAHLAAVSRHIIPCSHVSAQRKSYKKSLWYEENVTVVGAAARPFNATTTFFLYCFVQQIKHPLANISIIFCFGRRFDIHDDCFQSFSCCYRSFISNAHKNNKKK